jgi:hypothetical protein
MVGSISILSRSIWREETTLTGFYGLTRISSLQDTRGNKEAALCTNLYFVPPP